ncbi:hypothetical protein ACFL0X_02890, partial [Nanoarchaeota archaeon]
MSGLGILTGIVVTAGVVFSKYGIQYWRGEFPWYGNGKNIYIQREWITRKPCQPINPLGIYLHIPIIQKIMRDSEGNPISITGEELQIDRKMTF